MKLLESILLPRMHRLPDNVRLVTLTAGMVDQE